MYCIIDKKDLEKINSLFPEFEIIPEPENKEVPVLEKCILKMKEVSLQEKNKKEYTARIIEGKIKRMENERSMKNKVYEDDIEAINKRIKEKNFNHHNHPLAKFFKKK
jgi:hypothetical protein